MKRNLILTMLLLLGTAIPIFADTVEPTSTDAIRIGYYSQPGLMNGAKKGSIKSGFVYDYLQELARHTGWKYEYVYGTAEELNAKLQKGDIDILPSALTQNTARSESLPFTLSVAQGKSRILTEIKSAHQKIEDDNPAFFMNAKIKYYKDIVPKKEISQAGKDWLESHDVIRIGTFDKNVPYAKLNPDGSVVGIAPDYVDFMLKSLGIDKPVKWVFFDGKQSGLAALRKGQIDLFHPYYYNYHDAEQDSVVISSVAYASSMSFLYTGAYNDKTMSVIATPNTRLGATYVRDNYPNVRIVPCKDGFDCIDKLLSGKVTSVIVYTSVLHEIAKAYQEEFHIKALNSTCNVCFAALPSNSGLIDIFNSGIPFLTDVEMNSIESKHFTEELKNVTLNEYFKQHPEMVYAILAGLLVLGCLFFLHRYYKQKKYNRTLEKAKKEAEEANEAKTNFLFNMSHDIRTPMNAIIGYTNIARRNLDNRERLEESLDKSLEASQLLLSIINSILDMSHIEAGQRVVEEKPMDMHRSFVDIENTLKDYANTRNLDLKFEIGKITDRYVYGDRDKCTRIFLNIITNSIKYTNSGGKIKVRCEQIGEKKDGIGEYCYTFEDNGIGMSEEFQKHVFERFTREQSTTVSGVEGTGLGLHACKSFVDMMNGTIKCESHKGIGTKMTVILPFKIRDKADETKHLVAAEQGYFKSQKKNLNMSLLMGKKVLLVEDNESNIDITKRILEDKQMIVEVAEDGYIAVNLFKEKGAEYYDFILMDIQMPIMGGYEATRAIREMERSTPTLLQKEGAAVSPMRGPRLSISVCDDSRFISTKEGACDTTEGSRIPIIAVSANAYEEDVRHSLSVGMDAHIAKPINEEELFETLLQHI